MRWISVWTLIIAAFTFWAVPDMVVKGICVAVAIISLVVMRYYPPKETNKPIEYPKWLRTVGYSVGGVLAVVMGVLWVGSIILAIVKG